MPKTIRKIAVLGSDVMGGQIAAHFANAGIPSLVFDATQRTAEKGIKALTRLRPKTYFDANNAKLLTPCNYKDHLKQLDEVDWIIETVAEESETKLNLFNKILRHAKPETIVSSNTSGLTLKELSQWMPPEFTAYFLVTHFFNPPRYMHLVEVVHNEYTRPEVVKKVVDFCENVLGKGVIIAKDTPNFIANRIGAYNFMMTFNTAQKMNLSVPAVDRLTGPLIGRPKSSTFRTADIVGLDVLTAAAATTYEKCPRDERRDTFRVPAILEQMIEKNWVGQKSGGGFYKIEGSALLALNPNTLQYERQEKVDFASLRRAEAQHSSAERIKTLVESNDVAGRFVWKILANTLIYAANRIPEVSDDIFDIDNAMKWGLGWESGPFQTWEALGLKETSERMKAEGRKIPLWVEAMILTGCSSFYASKQGKQYYFDINRGELQPGPENPRVIHLRLQKEKKGAVLRHNESASLVNLGGKVLCAEFHHPGSNLFNPEVLEILEEALEVIPRKGYKGLVITGQGANFCLGADLAIILKHCQSRAWNKLDAFSKTLQELGQRLRYAPFPVVCAPFSKTLGSGLELALAADFRVAAAEFYGGLTEIKAGLIPFGGGILRLLSNQTGLMKKENPGPFPPVKKVFEAILFRKISSSAAGAFKLGYLHRDDRIVMNRDHLLYEAKQSLLKMSVDYIAPPPYDQFFLPGEGGRLTLEVRLDFLLKRGKISKYDCEIGKKLAFVLTGGDNAHPMVPLSEQTLLDLERETFVELCKESKTQARLIHLLKSGKSLQN